MFGRVAKGRIDGGWHKRLHVALAELGQQPGLVQILKQIQKLGPTRAQLTIGFAQEWVRFADLGPLGIRYQSHIADDVIKIAEGSGAPVQCLLAERAHVRCTVVCVG